MGESEKNIIGIIKKDFSFIKEKIEAKEIDGVLLYGSYAKNEQTIRSDIDICLVAPKLNLSKKFSVLLGYVWQNINANKYDVRIFEELPLYIKIDVIKSHKLIFSRNLPELYYYLYHYRKIWQDQSINWVELS